MTHHSLRFIVVAVFTLSLTPVYARAQRSATAVAFPGGFAGDPSIRTNPTSFRAVNLPTLVETGRDVLAVEPAFASRNITSNTAAFDNSNSDVLLPDAPASDTRPPASTQPFTQIAPRHEKYIDANERALPLSGRDKVLLGLRTSTTFFSLVSMTSAAGYEQLRNGSPNYGTNLGAYGQRLGAAAVRDTSELLFSDSFFAPLFHEDPRYYQLGEGHGFFRRTGYAISRVLVTRKDNGDSTPNYAVFAGYAGAIALTNAYYPPINRDFHQNAESYGISLGGNAFSLVVREFLPDALRAVHLQKLE